MVLVQKKGDLKGHGGDRKSKDQGAYIPTLKDAGLSKEQIHDWKPLVSVTERQLEKTCEVVKKRDGVVLGDVWVRIPTETLPQ